MYGQSSQEFLVSLQIIMGISVLFFWLAYFVRKKNKKLHVWMAASGVLSNLAGAVYLVVQVHYFGLSLYSPYSGILTVSHRIFATVITLMMFFMAFTGISGRKNLHVNVHKYFLIGYTITYISGIILFRATV